MELNMLERLVNIILMHNLHDDDERTVLHIAAEENDAEVANLWIEYFGYINVKDQNNKTALHIAAENNSIEVARLLVNADADIDAEDVDNKTALQLAKDKGFSELAGIIENKTSSNRSSSAFVFENEENKFIVSENNYGLDIMILSNDNLQRYKIIAKDKNSRQEIRKFFYNSTSFEDRKEMLSVFLNNNNFFEVKKLFDKNDSLKESDDRLKRSAEAIERIKNILKDRVGPKSYDQRLTASR